MTNKEICDKCKVEFIPKKGNDIWSFSTYEEPSSLMYYLCNKCIRKLAREEKEFNDKENQFYDNYKEDMD